MQKQTTYKLKNRQKEIINQLLRFRYLTRPQIQTLLNHKYKEKVIEWLNELTKERFVFRIYEKEFRAKPSEYCLDKSSISYLRENGIEARLLKRVYAEKNLSQTFRNHSKLIASIYLSLEKLVKETKATLHFYTQTDLYKIENLINPPVDAYFAIVEEDKTTKTYFLEVFDPLPPRMHLKGRIREYFEYFKSELWQEHTGKDFPEVIFVAPDQSSKKYLMRKIREKLGSEDTPIFYLLTWEEIETTGINRDTLNKVE